MKSAIKLVFVCILVAAPTIIGCGEKKRPPLVAILMLDDFRQPLVDGLQNGLGGYGYVIDDNIQFKILNAQGDQSALLRLADQLVALKPAVLVPVGGVEADACFQIAQGTDVPIVFAGVSSPIKRGLAESALKPRRNTTGVRSGFTDLVEKRLQLVSLFFPEIHKVTILYDPTSVPSRESLMQAQQVAGLFNLTISTASVQNTDEIKKEMARLTPQNCPILLGTPASLIFVARGDVIAPTAIKQGIIFFGFDRGAVDDGAALAYGANYYSIGTQTARLVHKVLMGFKPESMPIEMPLDIGLAINIQTLNSLKITLPAKVMGLADYVVQAEGKNATIKSF